MSKLKVKKYKSFIDLFNVVAAILMVWAASTLACNVPVEQYADDLYIYGVNTFVHYDGSGDVHNQSLVGADRVSFPATVWIQAVINRSGTGVHYNPYISCLQYKIKRPGDAAYGEWITVRTIIDPRWQVSFPDGPVALFEKNSFDIPHSPENSEILVRVYFGTEVSRSANPADDTDETGRNGSGEVTWSTKHVVKLISSGQRRPQ